MKLIICKYVCAVAFLLELLWFSPLVACPYPLIWPGRDDALGEGVGVRVENGSSPGSFKLGNQSCHYREYGLAIGTRF